MAQQQTSLTTRTKTHPTNKLGYSEINSLRDTINVNASDAETRLVDIESRDLLKDFIRITDSGLSFNGVSADGIYYRASGTYWIKSDATGDALIFKANSIEYDTWVIQLDHSTPNSEGSGVDGQNPNSGVGIDGLPGDEYYPPTTGWRDTDTGAGTPLPNILVQIYQHYSKEAAQTFTNTILSGNSDPTTEGSDGDIYLNTTTTTLFGPKTSGAWGSGTSLIGTDGADGADGADGKTVLNGSADPTTQGVEGDFYINTTSNFIFGPKTAGSWGAGTSLVGPSGSGGGGAKVIVLGIDGKQNLNNNTPDALIWDDSLDGIKDTEFTHSTTTNASRITVNQSGRYKIQLNLGIRSSVSSSRLTIGVRTRVNGTTNRPEIIGGYARVSGGSDEAEVTLLDYLTLTSGDYIEIIKRRTSSTSGSSNTTQDGGSMLIVSYEGA